MLVGGEFAHPDFFFTLLAARFSRPANREYTLYGDGA